MQPLHAGQLVRPQRAVQRRPWIDPGAVGCAQRLQRLGKRARSTSTHWPRSNTSDSVPASNEFTSLSDNTSPLSVTDMRKSSIPSRPTADGRCAPTVPLTCGRAGRLARTAVSAAEEAALKDVPAGDVLAIDPPGEVHQQFLKDAFEEREVTQPAVALGLDLVQTQGGPGMDRRVDVVEGPFVGRQLTVGMHVPLARQLDQLTLRELGIDQPERNDVESEIPSRVPGVLPRIGHR